MNIENDFRPFLKEKLESHASGSANPEFCIFVWIASVLGTVSYFLGFKSKLKKKGM
jgi:hypothetical protein